MSDNNGIKQLPRYKALRYEGLSPADAAAQVRTELSIPDDQSIQDYIASRLS